MRQPWWSIPEGERLQMHAFPRPSQQLRHKVRHALLRSLHYTFLYRRLILKIIEIKTSTQDVGKPFTAGSRLTLEMAQLSKKLYTDSFIIANPQSDTGMLLPMSAHYATNQTLAHTLRGKDLIIRLSSLIATMRRVNYYTQPFINT